MILNLCQFKKWIIIIICYGFVSNGALGKNYYVDKYASGSNNGTSWDNAWNSFNIIDWSIMKAGDILFISGGKDSTVYNESLNVGTSGNIIDYLTIRGGLDTNHNGKVIIDVQYVGIKIIKKSYIKISNLLIKNASHGVYIRGVSTGDVNAIYLDSLKVLNFTKQGAISINGWSSGGWDATVDSVFIKNCILTTSFSTTHQTDVIYAQYCNNLFILNNTISVTSKIKGSHTDAIQFVHNIKNITIANNSISNLTSSEANNKSNGIMGANLIGKGLFYNNIVYAPNFRNSGNNVFSYSNGTVSDGVGSWYIYNNVFIGGGTINLFKIEDKDAHIKNNIFYSIPHGTGQVILKAPLDNWSQLDYNLYGQNNGIKENKIINFDGSKSMNQMQRLGAELHGVDRQDPLFKIPFSNLHLQNDSPALDSGINLGLPFTKDKTDIERPKNGNWDLGCYQNSN